MHSRLALFVVSLGLLGASVAEGAEEELALPTLSRKPYIQSTTPSSSVVVWRTNGPSIPVLRFGEDPQLLDKIVTSGRILWPPGNGIEPAGEELEPQRLSSAPPNTYQYEFTLSDLEPATRYYYAVYHGERLLAGGDPNHYALTLPVPGDETPQRFWLLGDSGDGSLQQQLSYQAIKAQVNASGRELDAFIHLGDMAYVDGTDQEFQDHFFNFYDDLINHLVVWPTMGNHEGYNSSGLTEKGPYFDAYVMPTQGEAGGVASGTESYYAFDHGAIHFVCLNSHDLDRQPTGAMAQWLREDLSRNTRKWLIAFFHHPPYTKGTHDSDWEIELIEMREHIMPILESHGVDFVLAGHSHTYERSMLIDGAYATPTVIDGTVYDDSDGDPFGQGAYRKSEGLHPNEGTVAVVTGNGRGALQHFGIMPVMRRTVPETGSVLLDFDGDRMTGYMINGAGQLRDRFQIIKSGQVDSPERLAYPWQPFGPRVTTALLGSGKLKIALSPLPAAPDAMIYYTLDGTPPSTQSPVYEGPFIVAQDVILRTFSTWKGGERRSPETNTGWLRIAALDRIQVPVISGDDDIEVSDETVRADEQVLNLGMGTVAVRFPDVQLPPEVTITRAHLQFTAALPKTELGSLRIRMEKRSDSPSLVAPEHGLDTRPRSEGEVVWDVPAWIFRSQRSTSQRSPDLSDLIQEVVEESTWSSGGAMTFLLEGDVHRAAASVESGASRAPLLFIQYEPMRPLAAATSQPPRVFQSVWQGRLRTRLTFRRLTGRAGDRLHYEVEGSPTMAPGSWAALEGWEEVQTSVADGPWQLQILERQGPLEGANFIRFRITEAP